MTSIPFDPRERFRGLRPGNWPRIEGATVSGGAIRYDIAGRWKEEDVPGPSTSFWFEPDWADPLEIQDDRGRRLVEAFTAIPTVERFATAPERLLTEPVPDALVAFTMTFGPVLTPTSYDRVQSLSRDLAEGRQPQDDAWLIGSEIYLLREAGRILDELAVRVDPEQRAAYVAERAADEYSFFGGRGGHSWFEELWDEPLSRLRPAAVVDRRGRLVLTLRLTSLLDAVWWQLFEHARQRPRDGFADRPDPVFRTPKCQECGGVIMATRLAEDRVNRWHAGCKALGLRRRRNTATPHDTLRQLL